MIPTPVIPALKDFKILGISGARLRNTKADKLIVRNTILDFQPHVIVTGDCKRGADKFARYYAQVFGIKIIVCNAHVKGLSYIDMVKEYHRRNEDVAKIATHMLALPNKNGKGGTVHTIKMFKKHHEDWKDKLFVK